MITPVEIRQHTFRRVFRGFDTEEVKTFLKSLADVWNQVQDENRTLKNELEKAQESLRQYREMEDLMKRAMMQAEQNSLKAEEAVSITMENARRDAAQLIKQAEYQSREILRQAREERKLIESDLAEIDEKRNHLTVQLRMFLNGQLDMLASFESRKHTFTPSEAVRHRNAAAEAPEPGQVQTDGVPNEISEIEMESPMDVPEPSTVPGSVAASKSQPVQATAPAHHSFFDQVLTPPSDKNDSHSLIEGLIDEL